jgi:nucleoside-diphosphate-sugar epimerase
MDAEDRFSGRAPLALIVGARGGWGGAMAQTLVRRGWRVRAMVRGALPEVTTAAAPAANWSWVQGDALVRADVMRAAEGAQVLVHAANPPGYVRWRELAIPMLQHSMAAARQQGARLMVPGNVYNFGPDVGSRVGEDAPQHPLTRKGAVRVEMENLLQEAAVQHGLRSLVLRAGDFFGGEGPSSWFNTVMVKPGKPVTTVVDPHTPGVGHTWAYLPDAVLAATLCLELDLRQPGRLATAERLHFRGHELADGRELMRCVAEVVMQSRADLGQTRRVGKPVKIRSLPWPLLSALALVSPFMREVREMRYLWQQPLALDNGRLLALLSESGEVEPHTPLPQAVKASLLRMGCLPGMGAGTEPGATLPITAG